MAAYDLPVGMQLEKVHKYLKEELRPLSTEDILESTGVDIEGNADILLSLKSSDSKVTQDEKGNWRWKSRFYLRSRNDLFSLLSRSPDGIVEKDLLDSYKGVDRDVERLKKRNVVYEIRSGSRVILFPRDTRLESTISEDVKKEYTSVKVPGPIEVHRYLVARGLKNKDDTTGVAVQTPVARKRPKRQMKRKSRRVKLTNTHMADSGIDLNQDYKPAKDSAFG